MCDFEDGTRAARRRAYERRTRRTQAPLLQPRLVAVVRFGSLCSSSHTTKTALSSLQLLHPVRLFSSCVSLVCAVRECVAFCCVAPRRRSGTAFSRFVLPRACQPFVTRNELAIATKSIASVCPHAERTPWVPSNKVQRGNGDMGATRKTTRPVDEL